GARAGRLARLPHPRRGRVQAVAPRHRRRRLPPPLPLPPRAARRRVLPERLHSSRFRDGCGSKNETRSSVCPFVAASGGRPPFLPRFSPKWRRVLGRARQPWQPPPDGSRGDQSRRYTMVPPLPDFDESCCFLGAFLIDGDTDKAGGCIGMSNFRVLYMVFRGLAWQAAVFTMGESGSTSWSEKSVDYNATGPQFMYLLGHAGGSWYFYMEDRTLIILDGSTGEFSCSQLPITVTQDLNMSLYNFRITEGRDSKPRFFTTFCDSIKVFMRLCSGDWVLEKRVMLSEATRSLLGYRTSFFSHPPNILTLGVGFIILSPVCEMRWPFSVDLETMEASPAAGDMGIMVYRCELPWPPALPAMCHAMRNEALHQKVDRHW
ncbi:unnamed protein product, partial [Urochloa humidicola]